VLIVTSSMCCVALHNNFEALAPLTFPMDARCDSSAIPVTITTRFLLVVCCLLLFPAAEVSPRATAVLVSIFQAIDSGSKVVTFSFSEINRVLSDLDLTAGGAGQATGGGGKAKKGGKRKKKVLRTGASGQVSGQADGVDDDLESSPQVVALWRSLGLLNTFVER
jgi:hypothetical protein